MRTSGHAPLPSRGTKSTASSAPLHSPPTGGQARPGQARARCASDALLSGPKIPEARAQPTRARLLLKRQPLRDKQRLPRLSGRPRTASSHAARWAAPKPGRPHAPPWDAPLPTYVLARGAERRNGGCLIRVRLQSVCRARCCPCLPRLHPTIAFVATIVLPVPRGPPMIGSRQLPTSWPYHEPMPAPPPYPMPHAPCWCRVRLQAHSVTPAHSSAHSPQLPDAAPSRLCPALRPEQRCAYNRACSHA